MNKNIKFWLVISIIGCSTLGLAPYSPEPHIIGKIKWVVGGANGMTSRDYFDLILHGTPWVILTVTLVVMAINGLNKRSK
jgi:hypothetical protein